MMTRCSTWFFSSVFVLALIIVANAGSYTSDFNQYLIDNQPKDQVSAIITMADRVDLEALKVELYGRNANRQEWHEAVVRAYQDKATVSQAKILAKLEELSKNGRVTSYKSLWLGNLIIVTAIRSVYDELVFRDDVDQIAPDYEIESVKDMAASPDITANSETGLRAIRADECWEMGITGEGRLVSNLDSGVDGYHEALANRWRGLDSRYEDSPEWAWFDPVTNTDFPFDGSAHGTHTMGIICGLGEEDGDTIGVAFGAEWISAGVIDRVNVRRTVQDALAAFQWVTDPDGDPSTVWDVPDVCSNSWGVRTSLGYEPCDATLWEAIDGAEMAGVVVIYAAGNQGSAEGAIARPADRATTAVSTFSVGAVDGSSDTFPIASFSSRGPSYCTPDGSMAIKPEVCAPGMSVRSAAPGNNYSYLSGTSMAAPHVSGVVALIRQANPNLTSDQVKQIMLETAVDLGAEGDDNDYGMGMIDAYAAVQKALTYTDWGVLTGIITDEYTGEPLQGVTVKVVDREWEATSLASGSYYLYIPSDTLYNIELDFSPTHLPISDQQMVNAGDTTSINYSMEPKVSTTFAVSFGNPDAIAYRKFYMNGSWDNDGYYDPDGSGDLITMKNDGVYPDEFANDGVYTAQVLIVRDLDNTFSWAVYTENYGVNSLDDALLVNGSDFNVDNLAPLTVPTLEPNPSGSDNNFAFSVEGNNGLSLDLEPTVEGTEFLWGSSTYLTSDVTYTFAFHVMHGDQPVYGLDGVGGSDLVYTPTASGAYDFIFSDDDDSYKVQPSRTNGAPVSPNVISGLDGHVPVSWLAPGTRESIELSYDDGIVAEAWTFTEPENLIAVMFVPESYPVKIDSVMIRVITEGDELWPWPDGVHNPIGVSIYLDDGTGFPEADPVFYTEVTPQAGEWVRVDIGQIAVTEGSFWVAQNSTTDLGYEGIALDVSTDYPANQWYYGNGVWYSGGPSIYVGDNMIRAKVFSDAADTWLSYDDAAPAKEITAPVVAGNLSGMVIGTDNQIAFKRLPATSIPDLPNMLAYHPQILSDFPVITETEIVTGYNLYRSMTPAPFDQGMKINDNIITSTIYDDWGTDNFGPLANGTTYSYQVSAVYRVGGSLIEIAPWEQITGTPENHAPAAPANLTGEIDNGAVTLNWEANTEYDIVGYNIYRNAPGEDDFNLITTVTHPEVIYSENVSEDGTYRYKIKAVDADDMESDDYSNLAKLSNGAAPPGMVRASTDLEFQVKIGWQTPSNESDIVTDTEELNLALIYSEETEEGYPETEFLDYLTGHGDITSYHVFNALDGTPSFPAIEPYDMVIIWSNNEFSNTNTMSAVLSQYAATGKGIVMFNFCFVTNGNGLEGVFMDTYCPFTNGACLYTDAYLGEYDETSPLMAGVDELSSYFPSAVSTHNGANVVAYWDNGYPAVAASDLYPNIVCINAYAVTRWTGDMYQLVSNAIAFVNTPPLEDLDGYVVYRSDSEDGEYIAIDSLESNVTSYTDTIEENGVPYYYRLTALYGTVESEPSNIAEGNGTNHAPANPPEELTAGVNGSTVSLTWAFTDSVGDLDHFDVYRKMYGGSEWNLVGNSTTESYTDEITGDDGVYIYTVTAVDNGDPQLESGYSNSVYAPIGDLPPNDLFAKNNQDDIVPLHWYVPGTPACTTLAYDDGTAVNGLYFSNTTDLLAKQFTGSAPIKINGMSAHIITEGDEDWPWPNEIHNPVTLSILEDDGNGQPGSVLFDTTLTCALGEWLTVNFATSVTCNTDNFWIAWNNATGTLDGLGIDETSDYPEYEWEYESGTWQNTNRIDGDVMIRAKISMDGVITLSANDNTGSGTAIQTAVGGKVLPQICDTEEMLGYYIYRKTSPEVPIDDQYRITSDYLSETAFEDDDVDNGTTYYYVCASVYNSDGETKIMPSNEVTATPMNPGQFAIDFASIEESAHPDDDPVSVTLTLTNDGDLPVTYMAMPNIDGGAIAEVSPVESYAIEANYSVVRSDGSGSNPAQAETNPDQEETNPPVIASHGGPDNYGYRWVDSNDELGPEYNWIDITDIGERLTDMSLNVNIGPFNMGFDFPFYGNTFSTIRVCSNGYVSFTCPGSYVLDASLPSGLNPVNLIAPFWDFLNVPTRSSCYYYTNEDTTIISWLNYTPVMTMYAHSFQVILTSDGNITYQYKDVETSGYTATIGIQNGDATDGLTVSHNAAYFHDGMAIKIQAGWLSTNPVNGVIPAGGTTAMNITLDNSMLELGTYYDVLNFLAGDMNHNLDIIEVPVTFVVDTVTVSIDDSYTVLPTSFNLDQNYPNPFNANTEIRYALPIDSDVRLEVYDVLGRKVVTLANEKQSAGYHSLIWDGKNASGQVVVSGMYMYKLVTNENVFVKKMLMLK